jgi:hypothetical protein
VLVVLVRHLKPTKAHLVEILFFHQSLRLAVVVAATGMTVFTLENKTA